jgi:3-oxoacyl-[acyl-carrier-protein] synthase II
MDLRRVVITGMGAISPFGQGVDVFNDSLADGKSGIVRVSELESMDGVRSYVAGIVEDIDPMMIPRKYRRSMSDMSIYSVLACQEALKMGRVPSEYLGNEKMGVAIGSTIGSINTFENFFKDYLVGNNMENIRSTLFFKLMNHSCAFNVTQVLGIKGRVIAPSAACSTGCQAVGIGYEMIAYGKQDYMLCGGSDEFHPLTTISFDLINAASTGFNSSPSQTPRPFDRDRDGIVCSEGCGILLLESLESAKERGADILGEIIGFATSANPSNIANPSAESMITCMKKALADGKISPEYIDYVNAHATATIQGDIEESKAIYEVCGGNVPVSSLKGHVGHTMAASGSLELIATIDMIRKNRIIPTLNLENIDDLCNSINLSQDVEKRQIKYALKNNFALGGVNASLVLRSYENDK